MPEVSLKPVNEKVNVPLNKNLLDVLLEKDCRVMMACGRQGICATCHVYVENGMESLSPRSDRENKTLALITGATDYSRLSCQCNVVGEEPIDILLPDGIYLESFDELKALIGKRTQFPILHPIDGYVLIEENKIITRTIIMKLANTNFDPNSVITGV